MALARPVKNSAKSERRQVDLHAPIKELVSDDELLNMVEVMAGWDLTAWEVRRLVIDGKVRRVRRPGYQPYYPLSSVVRALGEPLHPLTPRYRRSFEFGERAA